MQIAIEMHLDPDDVLAWPLSKVHLTLEGFKRKGDREREAMEKARKEAEREAKLKR